MEAWQKEHLEWLEQLIKDIRTGKDPTYAIHIHFDVEDGCGVHHGIAYAPYTSFHLYQSMAKTLMQEMQAAGERVHFPTKDGARRCCFDGATEEDE